MSQLTEPKRQFLRRVNPLLKIIFCFIFVGVALILYHPWAIAVLVGILLLLLLLSVSIDLKIVGFAAIALLFFLAFSTSLRGLQISLLSTLRLIAMLLPTPLLAGTTSPSDLVRALQTARLPSFLILSLMLIWRFLPLIQQEAQRIIEANWLRGVELSRQPAQWFAGLFMPLIFRMVAYADEVTVGLETRGYSPSAPRSLSQPLEWRTQDTVFVVVAVLTLALVGYLEWGAAYL